jgi:hypothetical protein
MRQTLHYSAFDPQWLISHTEFYPNIILTEDSNKKKIAIKRILCDHKTIHLQVAAMPRTKYVLQPPPANARQF